MTNAQLLTLKTSILADATFGPIFSAPTFNSDHAFAIADAYNLLADPAFIVWRTDVPTKDCKKAMVWTEFIARSAGEREAWQFMLSNGTINAADANVRQGILDIFNGPSGANTRTALTAIAKRSATRAEKLFATGTGSDAVPAVMGFEGRISYQDVLNAKNAA